MCVCVYVITYKKEQICTDCDYMYVYTRVCVDSGDVGYKEYTKKMNDKGDDLFLSYLSRPLSSTSSSVLVRVHVPVYMAYFLDHSLASSSYLALSVW